MYILWFFLFPGWPFKSSISVISLCMCYRTQVEVRGHLAGFTSLLHDMNVSLSRLTASDFSWETTSLADVFLTLLKRAMVIADKVRHIHALSLQLEQSSSNTEILTPSHGQRPEPLPRATLWLPHARIHSCIMISHSYMYIHKIAAYESVTNFSHVSHALYFLNFSVTLTFNWKQADCLGLCDSGTLAIGS